MSKPMNLAGRRFGRLQAIERAGSRQGNSLWRCLCDCGKELVIIGNNLCRGLTVSCGCSRKGIGNGNYKHGFSHTRLFYVWASMKNRCYNQKVNAYKYYGGRGIIVCDERRHDFEAFREWEITTGYDENAPFMECSLDRIDVNGNYEPDNCRWATAKEQANNRRMG